MWINVLYFVTWERVSRTSFLFPLKSFTKNYPEWDDNIEEIFWKRQAIKLENSPYGNYGAFSSKSVHSGNFYEIFCFYTFQINDSIFLWKKDVISLIEFFTHDHVNWKMTKIKKGENYFLKDYFYDFLFFQMLLIEILWNKASAENRESSEPKNIV